MDCFDDSFRATPHRHEDGSTRNESFELLDRERGQADHFSVTEREAVGAAVGTPEVDPWPFAVDESGGNVVEAEDADEFEVVDVDVGAELFLDFAGSGLAGCNVPGGGDVPHAWEVFLVVGAVLEQDPAVAVDHPDVNRGMPDAVTVRQILVDFADDFAGVRVNLRDELSHVSSIGTIDGQG